MQTLASALTAALSQPPLAVAAAPAPRPLPAPAPEAWDLVSALKNSATGRDLIVQRRIGMPA